MSRTLILRPFVVLVWLLCAGLTFGQNDLQVWREFRDALKSGSMTVDRIRPYDALGDSFKPILLSYLDSLRARATAEDWVVVPEVIRNGNRIQYIAPWTEGNRKVQYCFSFLTEGSRWYFQHLEAIMIRLDKVSRFPATDFPDIPEEQKSWAREEIYWSFVIQNIYLPSAREKGQQAALDMLKDGGGYFMAAKAWVPFVSPRRAFVLYLCWEQKNLRGNDVTLVKLDDHEAIVKMKTQYFSLYTIAAHLKPVISFDDYRQIFESLWQDRASNAGWNLNIEYSSTNEVTFHFMGTPAPK